MMTELDRARATEAVQGLLFNSNGGIINANVDDLQEYARHAFAVRDDDDMRELVDSVARLGIQVPLIVRRIRGSSNMEIISGHRRWTAAKKAGLTMVPVIVRNLDDDEADVLMADSNLQREKILPSEKARAYRIKLEAMKRQAGRPQKEPETKLEKMQRKNCGQLDHNFSQERSRDLLAANSPDSSKQIQRYIRLTYLIPSLLKMVDDERLPMQSAVFLSYLPEETQQRVYKAVAVYKRKSISASEASMLRDLYREKDNLPDYEIDNVLAPERKPKKEPIPVAAAPVVPAPTSRIDLPHGKTAKDLVSHLLEEVTALQWWARAQGQSEDAQHTLVAITRHLMNYQKELKR